MFFAFTFNSWLHMAILQVSHTTRVSVLAAILPILHENGTSLSLCDEGSSSVFESAPYLQSSMKHRLKYHLTRIYHLYIHSVILQHVYKVMEKNWHDII